MRAAVVTFPGSNCDEDLSYVWSKLCGLQVDTVWHKDEPDLSAYDLIGLPGGFSYGDYLRCGAMASLSPVMAKVKEAAAAGKAVIGICNGFQILCESGLLPGALARNQGLLFRCEEVALTVTSNTSPWTQALTVGSALKLPIAHGDGRYIVDEATAKSLEANGQILLKYAGKNPNGSTLDIAGLCNETRNVFGLMPHPERASDLLSKDGAKIWNSILSHLGGKG